MSITEQLKAPFDPRVIHWRTGATNAKKLGVKPWEATKGIALAYINARDVMQRLDDVCGDLWQTEYPFEGCCRIGIKIGDEWVWRSNGAGETDIEGEKGRYSDAFKRAAVLWGLGRYLYFLPNVWCELNRGNISIPPKLPPWAMPGKIAAEQEAKPTRSPEPGFALDDIAKQWLDAINAGDQQLESITDPAFRAFIKSNL